MYLTMPTKKFWDIKSHGLRIADGFDDNNHGIITGSHIAKSEEIINEIEKIVETTLNRLGSKKPIKYGSKNIKNAKSRIRAINKDRKGTRKEIMDKVRNLFEL
jgi:transposase